MTGPTALIVGAGIGGLAAGVALRRAGWQVRIFERTTEPRALGFALSLAPNAVRALHELGLAERVIAQGCVIHEVEVRRPDGRVLKRFDVAAGLRDVAAVFALRSALHGTLLEATDPEGLTLGREAVGFTVAASGVSLLFKDGSSATGNILVGADGVGSIVRRRLHPDEPPPRRSGYFAIRGVAYHAAGHLGDLSVVGYLGAGIEAATVRASTDAVYWYMSLLAEDSPARESSSPGTLQRCGTLLDDGFRQIVRVTKPDDVRVDELFERDPLENWGSGPVTLLGDAAHPMLPHTGQGAAQALEDAVALGLAVAPTGNHERALRRYERIRAQRTRPIVKRGPRIARFTTTRSPVIGFLRAAAIRLVPAKRVAAAFLLAGRADPHRALRESVASTAPTVARNQT